MIFVTHRIFTRQFAWSVKYSKRPSFLGFIKTIYKGEDVIHTEDSEKYLDDIITNNGKNDKNIKSRENRGRGITKDFLATIVEMFAGAQHHELRVTLRNAMLINSLLTNSESWYNVTLANIATLEKVDEHMLRDILKAPRMCPKALLYLELGCLPNRYIIKSRRIMFFTLYPLSEGKFPDEGIL